MPPSIQNIGAEGVRHAFARNALLCNLDPDIREILSGNARRLSCSRGQMLNHPGQPVEFIHLVLSGTVSRVMFTEQGNERILALHGPDELCGLSALFADADGTVGHAIAEPAMLTAIPIADMRRACEKSHRLVLNIAAHLAGRQYQLEGELVSAQVDSANDRVLKYLSTQCETPTTGDAHEPCLVLPASKQTVAARLGMTPESFSRALRELTNAGLIVNRGRSIILRGDPQRMAGHLRGRRPVAAARPRDSRPTFAHPALPPRGPSPELINIAGRQRMLSERMAKAWIMLGRRITPDKGRRILQNSIALYEGQREILKSATDLRRHQDLERAEAASWMRYRGILLDEPSAKRAAELLDANAAVLELAEKTTGELVRDGDFSGTLINQAGRQRMLAQRMAKNFLAKPWRMRSAKIDACIASDQHDFHAGLDRLADVAIQALDVESRLARIRMEWHSMQQFFGQDVQAINDTALATGVVNASERLVSTIDDTVDKLVRWVSSGHRMPADRLIAA